MEDSKVAIVTGGTGALGRVVAEKLASEGCKVYVPVRSVEKFRRVFDSSRDESAGPELRKIYGLPCHADNEDDVNRFTDDVIIREKRIDFLVNTIGGFHASKNIHEMGSELVMRMLSLNFYSTFYFCRSVLPFMMKSNYGRIIAVAAKTALEITPGKFAYSLSKQAVVTLIRTIAEESSNYDISACVIVPHIIDTESNRSSMPDADFSGWTTPADIASTIYSFVTDEESLHGSNVIKTFDRKP